MTSRRTAPKFPLGAFALALAYFAAPAPTAAFPGDALGNEFRVNEFTAGEQGAPAIAHSANGDFIVTWADYSEYTSGIYFRRYRANGAPRDPEPVRVDTPDEFAFTPPHAPDVAVDLDGDFVVSWLDLNPRQNRQGVEFSSVVFVRRYSSLGRPRDRQAKEVARSGGFSSLGAPSVAMDAVGNFVVVYDETGFDAPRFVDSCYGAYASRYAASGNRLGDQSVGTEICSFRPSVAMEPDGDFVVAYEVDDYNPRTGGYVSARLVANRYQASGAARNEGSIVVAPAAIYGSVGDVAVEANGDFIVTWSNNDDGYPLSQSNVLFRRFTQGGVLKGAPIQVNTDMAGLHARPRIGMAGDGAFTIAWERETLDRDNKDVYQRVFDRRARPIDAAETLVNTFTMGDQSRSALSVNADGSFVVAWEGAEDQDGSGGGVYARRFDGQLSIPEVSFQTDTQRVTESTNTATVTIELSRPSSREVIVPLVVGGTATENQDYRLSTHSMVVAVGETTATVSIQILEDREAELRESILLKMGRVSNASKGLTGVQHRVKIDDND